MTFEEIYKINVNDKTEKKNNLTYLSWAWAWAEFKKIFPDAEYEIKMFDGKPYVADENLGYMVFTSVTADNHTYDMYLPVMDNNNNAMKSVGYTVKTKYKEISVAPASMFDVNKAIMRCLTKNLAMFGLGLYIYAGEDIPNGFEETQTREAPAEDDFFAMKSKEDAVLIKVGDKVYPLNKIIEGKKMSAEEKIDYLTNAIPANAGKEDAIRKAIEGLKK